MKLDTEAITVTRAAAGSYVSGRFVAGESTVYPDAAGNIQPMGGRELQQLPEGDREREPAKIYTAFALENKDIVTRASGKQYEVQAVEDWTKFKQPHYKARLLLAAEE